MREGVWLKKHFFDKMTAMKSETNLPEYGFCTCIDSAIMGQSTHTTASFDGVIRYFAFAV